MPSPTNELKIIGARGEERAREWLKANGYTILPASLLTAAGAPLIQDGKYKFILPDNLSWKNNVAKWVEVKTKSFPTEHYKKPHRLEHGFPLRHWCSYDMIQQLTGHEVNIAVIELCSRKLLLSDLDSLRASSRIYFMDREWHIYLERELFEQYEINNLPEPIKPKAKRTLEQITNNK